MAAYTLFHNPRCSKSRAVHAILEEHGADFEVFDYLNDPLTADDVRAVLDKLGLDDPRALMRTKESAYRDADCANHEGDDLITAMLEHRVLIERPILIRGDRAVIGRPPEEVNALLGD